MFSIQPEKIRSYADKWRKIGLSIAPANRLKAENGIQKFYQSNGLRTPSIKWFDSPKAMFDTIIKTMPSHQLQKWIQMKTDDLPDTTMLQIKAELQGQLDSSIWDGIRRSVLMMLDVETRRIGLGYGQHYVAMYALHDVLIHEFGVSLPSVLRAEAYVAQHSGWWLPYYDTCYICERPSTLHLDEQKRPHNPNGYAIAYPDGWGIYLWHGVNVPEWIITQPHKITPDKILSADNIEIARVMLDRYGQDKFIHDGGFSKVQSDTYGDLYRIEFENGDEPIVAVKVRDSSTNREYFLYVPPHIRTAHEGVAWSFGYDSPDAYRPDIET